jgi:hypothetical protein
MPRIRSQRALWVLLCLVLALKLSYLLVAVGAEYLFAPLPFDLHQPDPRATHGAFFIFNHGDTRFYQEIAQNGYPYTPTDSLTKAYSVHAFWPTYPLLVGGVMRLTGASFNLAALALALVLSLAAFALAYDWYRRVTDEATAFWSTLLLLVFPFHAYYSFFYTESLFLLLSVAGFWVIERRQFSWLLVISPLLVLTRANGIFVCAALLLRLVEVVGWPRTGAEAWQRLGLAGYLLPAALALLGYLLFQYERTGDYLAFSTVQAAWGRSSALPWQTLAEGYRSVTGSFQATYVLAAMVLAAVGLRRYPLSWQVLVWAGLLLPLLSGLTQSLPRYVSTLFPLFLVLGSWLARQRPGAQRGVVVGALVLHWLSLLPWLYDHHAGY